MSDAPPARKTDKLNLSLVAYTRSEWDEGTELTADYLDELAAFCAEQGFRLAGSVHEQPTKTAKPFEERPGGREALRLIREAEAQGILVWNLGQAFSSVADAVATLERWIEEGVAFACVSFLNDRPLIIAGRDDDNMSISDIFSGLGQFHRIVAARKVRAQMETKRSRGDWLGRVPYGFIVVDGRLAEDPVQMKHIVDMKRAHRRGKSYREIASRFGISVATAHRLVNTDLRLLKRGRVAPRRATPTYSGPSRGETADYPL